MPSEERMNYFGGYQMPIPLEKLKWLIRTGPRADIGTARAIRRERAKKYVDNLEKILAKHPHLAVSLADVAAILDLERTYCSRIFRELTGQSFSGWTRRIRISRAQELLRLDAYTITEVSLAVGYSDITTFERNFRRELGASPTSFLKANHAVGSSDRLLR